MMCKNNLQHILVGRLFGQANEPGQKRKQENDPMTGSLFTPPRTAVGGVFVALFYVGWAVKINQSS